MGTPYLVRFNIPEDAPPCEIMYFVSVKKNGEEYGSPQQVILQIVGK